MQRTNFPLGINKSVYLFILFINKRQSLHFNPVVVEISMQVYVESTHLSCLSPSRKYVIRLIQLDSVLYINSTFP